MVKLTFKNFFEGLKEEKLIGLKCEDCGAYTCPPLAVCQECGGERTDETELEKEGVIKTFTVVKVAPKGYEEESPYISCIVKTKDGPWIPGRLAVDPEKASNSLLGKEVRIESQILPSEPFFPDREERVVPLFKLKSKG